ncbi:MAG: aldo/keto reductase [Halodesulfurarchaeum sp.]
MSDPSVHTADIPTAMTESGFRRAYGTYEVSQPRIGDEAYTDIIATAIDVGYRHFDAAQDYDTEPLVGEALTRTAVPRDEVFIATKLRWDNLGYEDAIETARESRERLGVDTIDLLYVHIPVGTYDPAETLPALDALVDDGVVDRIGMSNCTPEILADAIGRLEAPLYAHQIELHPLLQQEPLRDLAVEDGHWVIGFSPYMRGLVREITELREIADRHDTTPFDVALAWLLSKPNVAVLSHSTDASHMRANLERQPVALEEDDIETIDSIDRAYRMWDTKLDPWNRPTPDYLQ